MRNAFSSSAFGVSGGLPLTGGTLTGAVNISVAGVASTPPLRLTGAIFTGGTTTTTKPQFLIEPTGATSNNWSTSGTCLGVNGPSGFVGNLLDLETNGSGRFSVNHLGVVSAGSSANNGAIGFAMTSVNGTINFGSTGANDLLLGAGIVAKLNGSLRFGFTGGTDPTLTASASALTMSQAKFITQASTTGLAGLNIPAGTAPTSPVNGDIWQDGTDVKIRIGGVTKTFTIV